MKHCNMQRLNSAVKVKTEISEEHWIVLNHMIDSNVVFMLCFFF